MQKLALVGAAALALTLGGCLGAHNRTTTGAVIGGGVGAVIGGATTGTVTGAAIGGALGAGAGAIIGKASKRRDW